MNEHQRRQQEMKDARGKFVRALSAGQVNAVDRFGRPLAESQRVLWNPPQALVFDVVSVTPVLDPNRPVGLMQVTLSVTVPLQVPANSPDPSMVIISEATRVAAPTPLPEGFGDSGPLVLTDAPDEGTGDAPAAGDDDQGDRPGPKLVLTDQG